MILRKVAVRRILSKGIFKPYRPISTLPRFTFSQKPTNALQTKNYCSCSHWRGENSHQSSTSTFSMSNRKLLPTFIKPLVYKLRLEPDLEKCVFTGHQEITFKSNKPTKRIIINSKELDITQVYFIQNGQKHFAKISYEIKDFYAVFDFDFEINHDGSLFMEWTGVLNDMMAGFYRSKYTNAKGEQKWLATTQFESTDARRCLPCFDEPSIKAVFEVTLVVPEDRIALSNMNCTSGNSEILSGANGEKKKIVTFAPSPIMSTYLLAFIVGEFDFVEGKTEGGLPCRVYTPLGKKEQGRFGLEVIEKVIPLYEQYFKEKYPLPKVDMIAIPDFAAGAMENWGLITYRETALLYDAKQSSAKGKQRVALVVAHEAAHMWFGNLVTMTWWDYLWLNEGFATWIEYLAVDSLFPEWNIFEQFVDGEFAAAQRLDGLESSHPIEVAVNHAHEIDEIFDGISYAKGCAVNRMLAEYVGLETFKNGLRTYLSAHKYGNATSTDLWNAVGTASGKDIATLMDSWTKKMGYPLITVSQVGKHNGKRTIKVSQHRYLNSGHKDDDSLWHIPLGYITSKSSTPVFTLFTEREFTLQVDDDIEWIKFNPGQTGFYRVSYPDEYYEPLKKAISKQQLSSIDRLGIQNDICALARSAHVKTSRALDVLSAYSTETNYIVWSGVSGNLSAIWNLIKFESWSTLFVGLAQHLYKPMGQKLGWDAKQGESHLDTLLRGLIIGNLGSYGDKEIVEIAKKKFVEFNKDNSAVAPDMRSTLYGVIFEHGTNEDFDAIMNLYKTTTLNEERVRILGQIGSVASEEKLKEVLDWAWSEAVKKQDTFYPFSSVGSNKLGREMVWKFFQQNVDEFVKRYSSGLNFMGHFVKIASSSFNTDEKLKEVTEFFEKHPIQEAARAIQQSIEVIKMNSAWLKRDGQDIKSYLENKK
jgi:puromycin-sensitive aminopeptidase